MKNIIAVIVMSTVMTMFASAVEPEIKGPSPIANPGNGFFRIQNQSTAGFSSITIQQKDPDIALSGTLTFKMGAFEAVIDLGAGDRHLQIGRHIPFLDVTIAGVDENALFSIVLI